MFAAALYRQHRPCVIEHKQAAAEQTQLRGPVRRVTSGEPPEPPTGVSSRKGRSK